MYKSLGSTISKRKYKVDVKCEDYAMINTIKILCIVP